MMLKFNTLHIGSIARVDSQLMLDASPLHIQFPAPKLEPNLKSAFIFPNEAEVFHVAEPANWSKQKQSIPKDI